MQYVLPFILAMVVTMAWVPVLMRVGNRLLIVDRPGERKVHTVTIPRVGGLAMVFGVLMAAVLMVNLRPEDRWFLAAGGVLVLFGALDDRFDLDYRIKLLGQIIAVSMVVVLGDVQIRALTFDDRWMVPGWISMPLTVFFLVGVTNAINLADGLDGLAGGTSFLCLCGVALLSIIGGQDASTALALTIAGAVLGFLRFNTYPASVFMGDAGSQFLGFSIGVLSIRATQGAQIEISTALPVLLLALPILDTLTVMVQRISEGRSPFSADKNHIHHKLLALGFDHHEAVMVIYAVQAVLFVFAYFLRFETDLVILGVVSVFFLGALAFFQLAARTGWRLRDAARPGLESPLRRFLRLLQRPGLLPRISYAMLAGGLGTYALVILANTTALSADVRILVLALLATTVVFLVILRIAPLSIFEKTTLYVTAAVLVYLDAGAALPTGPSIIVGWVAIGVAAAATALRLRLYDDRRFELTPLDLIVLFMALVVPSLPGSLQLPHGGALGIAKLVVLFYGIEMLVSRAEERSVYLRFAVASVLAALALRSLLPFP